MVRRADKSDQASADAAAGATGVPSRSRRRLVGQPDCAREEGLEAQMQRAWVSLFDAIEAAGYDKRDLVKTTVCVTEGGQVQLFRTVRDRMMRGHRAASAYLHVPQLGAAAHLVEIEGEVVRG